MTNFLRLEGLAVLIVSLLLYARHGQGWLLFALLFLVPDVSMAGYLKSPRLGAWTYNAVHSYVAPIGLAVASVLTGRPLLVALALIWTAHIGFDRAMGYGLKLGSFQETHLGRIGRMRYRLLFVGVLVNTSGCLSSRHIEDTSTLRQQVVDTEIAFAGTMADRDHAAFTSFLSDEAVFFSGERALRGKDTVATEWGRFFEGTEAPFSWEPDHVEVLQSGSLALSTGPVRDPTGRLVGRFTSIWRKEAPGRWRIVFDRGNPVCEDN